MAKEISDLEYLSDSSNGAPIAIAATATDIHTVPTSTRQRVKVYACNKDSGGVLREITLTVLGTAVAPMSIPADDGWYLVEDVIVDADSGDDDISAVASAASAILVKGEVYTISDA